MSKQKKQGTVEIATELIEPIAQELGLTLWDIRFEKEGSQWYLRYLIEKEGGVTIEDCENASRAVGLVLDEADPIPQQYILEVGSPGIERRLTKDWHFQAYIGAEVYVRLFKPFDGNKDFYGILLRKENEEIAIQVDENNELTFTQKEAAFVQLSVDF